MHEFCDEASTCIFLKKFSCQHHILRLQLSLSKQCRQN